MSDFFSKNLNALPFRKCSIKKSIYTKFIVENQIKTTLIRVGKICRKTNIGTKFEKLFESWFSSKYLKNKVLYVQEVVTHFILPLYKMGQYFLERHKSI